jgi:hypothetical protein
MTLIVTGPRKYRYETSRGTTLQSGLQSGAQVGDNVFGFLSRSLLTFAALGSHRPRNFYSLLLKCLVMGGLDGKITSKSQWLDRSGRATKESSTPRTARQ